MIAIRLKPDFINVPPGYIHAAETAKIGNPASDGDDCDEKSRRSLAKLSWCPPIGLQKDIYEQGLTNA